MDFAAPLELQGQHGGAVLGHWHSQLNELYDEHSVCHTQSMVPWPDRGIVRNLNTQLRLEGEDPIIVLG
ncbi:hypothetical protein ABKN59_009439 [Abortiporus biennis]